MNPIPYSSWREGMEAIVTDMPESIYRSASGVNVSSLKPMRLSPAHYRYAIEEDDDDRKTSALVVGTLVHKARLEPEGFGGCYVVRPAQWEDWRTKDAKAWRDAQTLPVLTPSEEEVVFRCAKALAGVEILNQMAAGGFREVVCFKRHERTGLMLKGRADLMAHDADGKTWLLDIKTVIAGMASRDTFAKRIADLDYHMQDAFYSDLFGADHFVFVAVEKVGYNGVGIYQLGSDDRELGRRTNDALLQKLAECRRSDIWPGYPQEVRSIELPRWKRKQESEDVE